MTVEELMELPVGTIVYNGHTEGMITLSHYGKVISIDIPIDIMCNDATDENERPQLWIVL